MKVSYTVVVGLCIRPWKMVMVDQRNHGASAGLPLHPPHSIEAAAGDLTNLVQTELGGRVPKAMLGHSLGGKIVLEFLRQSSQEGHELPQQVMLDLLERFPCTVP